MGCIYKTWWKVSVPTIGNFKLFFAPGFAFCDIPSFPASPSVTVSDFGAGVVGEIGLG